MKTIRNTNQIFKDLLKISYRYMNKKLFYTSLLIFLIAYIHNTLRVTRDSLTISQLSAESLSTIKLIVSIPATFIAVAIYLKIASRFNRACMFHITCWSIISYFILYTTILYPYGKISFINTNREIFSQIPFLKCIILIINHWPSCLYYAFSECWIMLMMSITFWQIANNITSIEEAKTHYFIFAITAQLGILSSSITNIILIKETTTADILNKTITIIALAAILLSLSLIRLEKIVGTKKFNSYDDITNYQTKKATITKNFTYIRSSKPIFFITLLIFLYNVSANLIEDVWKKSLETVTHSNMYYIQNFLNHTTIYIAIFSILSSLFGIYIIKKTKWRVIALITPIAILLGNSLFFILIYLKLNRHHQTILNIPILMIATYGGAINNIFTRTTKHTLFDTAKEIIYIPLSNELKTKGKAAAESIGANFGKGISAIIEQILFISFPNYNLIQLSNIIAIICLFMLLCWIYTTLILSKWLTKQQIL